MDDAQDSFGKTIAFFVMMISYGMALFTSIIWISFLPNVYYGFRDLKAEVVIGGIFQLSWMFSNLFALLGHGMLLVVYSKLRWFCILMIIVQLILYFSVKIFVG